MSVPESVAPEAHRINLAADLRAASEFVERRLQRQRKWDLRFLELAKHIAGWSKDPSTKTGAVIVDKHGAVIGTGYNGFARLVKDAPERYADRDLKVAITVHCEENAILFGDRTRMDGATLYTWPFQSCAKCAGAVIQVGIRRCVAPPIPADKADRWAKNMELARVQFAEAGVRLDIIPLE